MSKDFILFYPDKKKHLSDNEFKKLAMSIESGFLHAEEKSFQMLLCSHMKGRGVTARTLYNAALIEKSYYYQILNGKRPSRDVAIRISLALKLNLGEANRLLQAIGYTFFEKCRRDIIIAECIKHKAGLFTAEILLEKYGEVSLCNKLSFPYK